MLNVLSLRHSSYFMEIENSLERKPSTDFFKILVTVCFEQVIIQEIN